MGRWALMFLSGVLLGTAWAGEAPPAFTKKPAATRAGDKTKIEFAVDRSTDVEVAVLGADGKVVRHLAAGVLGGRNDPPAPLKPGLAQSLEWDGCDDLGKPAAGGPLTVRVRVEPEERRRRAGCRREGQPPGL